MRTIPHLKSRRIDRLALPSAFALVVTLSLMVLLTLLCVGLLGLSASALRGTSTDHSAHEARANARLAVVIAIGELQKHLGPDQRISANAGVLGGDESSENPEWLGVWDANTDRRLDEAIGQPTSFRSWLVSGPASEEIGSAGPALANGVIMGAAGSSGKRLKAGLQTMPGSDSSLAWVVSDESMKARIDLPTKEAAPDEAHLIARRYAPARLAPEAVPGMSGFDPGRAAELITTKSTELLLGSENEEDGKALETSFTSDSISLLTDVVNGGFKRDINTLFELPEQQIDEGEYGVWSGSKAQASRKAHLYGVPGVTLGARWNHLYAYYNLYKQTRINAGVPVVKPSGQLVDWRLADQFQDFGDEAGGFRFPRIAKIIYMFSYAAEEVRTGADRGKYKLMLVTDVFITVWNPFNARIEFPASASMFIKLSKDLPMSFEWQAGGLVRGNARLGEMFQGEPFLCASPMRTARSGGRLFQMDPGETLLFTMGERSSPIDVATGTTDEPFYPGVRFDGGFSTTRVLGTRGELVASGDTRVAVSLKPRNDSRAFDLNGFQTSQYVDFWIYDNNRTWPYYEHRGEIIARADTPFTSRMPEIKSSEVRSVSLAEVAGRGRKQPFGAFIMEIKTAEDSRVPSLAFLHSGISRLSSRVDASNAKAANERFEYKLESVTGWDSDVIQTTVSSHPAGANHGFIGSGRSFASGQTHFVQSEIPVLPMLSLSQFKNAGVGDGASVLRATYWGFNSTPTAPYMDNAIGNSYAHPLLPAARSNSGELYDQSYLGNEALWDRYFCSSLAPQTGDLFAKKRSLEAVWNDFVKNGEPMLNPRFQVWKGGRSDEEIVQSVLENGGSGLKKNAYKRIGGELTLTGGFNVNSLSEEAWRAFLSSNRHNPIWQSDAINGQMMAGGVATSGSPFSRSAMPSGGSIDAAPDDRSLHYLGFRELSDVQIEALAENVVEQVRKRGPFRSLADFVNRRLSRDAELNLTGALQAAIDGTDINDPIAAGGVAVPLDRSHGYAYPEAAAGNSATGAPGWLMQADLLDALGPLITVRGDTFTVRGYGESRAKNGTIQASAWCEAIVQRVPTYLDESEDHLDLPKHPVNRNFGRKLEVRSFRWLADYEL